MAVFGIALVIFLICLLLFTSLLHIFLPLVIVFAAVFILSCTLMNSGRRRKNVIGRLSRYVAALSDKKNVLKLDGLAAATGILPAQIRSDMRLLKRWGLHFDLYMDKSETTLIRGESVYKLYLDAERQREAREREEAERQSRLRDPETATLETFSSEGRAILDKLRAANLVLPGEAISNSLSELETTMKRIFGHIEGHPDKLPETRKLMNYHLPTTMKLVDKYCQYDTMEYQPENIAAAKADIEKALVAANEAFANFLRGLYREDTLDITAEAEVLTKMFEKDGLTGAKFDIGGDQNK
jgi:hypothetical protein